MTTTDDLLAKLEVIAVQPGDSLIFQANQPLSQDQIDQVRRIIAEHINPRIRVLVVDSHWTLRVLRPTEDAEPL